jgi:hypothetical protein
MMPSRNEQREIHFVADAISSRSLWWILRIHATGSISPFLRSEPQAEWNPPLGGACANPRRVRGLA